MVALSIVAVENSAWLRWLCFSCRVSEWLSGGYGYGRCLSYCPLDTYGATVNMESWRVLTIEAQSVPLIEDSRITSPAVEASEFVESTATDGCAETMLSTIHVEQFDPSVSPSTTSTAMVTYIRTEQRAPAIGFLLTCLLILQSCLFALWSSLLILMSIAIDPLGSLKLFVLFIMSGYEAFVFGMSGDTGRLNISLVAVVILLYSLYSAAVALHGRAIKQLRFGLEGNYPLSDDIMRLQPPRQEAETSRDGLQEDLDNEIEKNKKLIDTHNDTLAKINTRIAELEAQLKQEQAETKKAKDERNKKEDRILVLEAEIKEEKQKLEQSNSTKKALRDAHQEELTNLREAHQAELIKVQERHEAQLRKTRDENDEQMTQLRTTHEADVSEMSTAHEFEIKALKSTHEEELRKVKDDGESTRISHGELQTQLVQLKATHKCELDKAHEAGEKAKREMEAAHKLELDNVRDEAGKELAQLKANHSQEKEANQQRTSDARTAQDNEIAEQKSIVEKLKLELDNEKKEVSHARTQIARRQADKVRLQNNFQDAKRIFDATEKELEETRREVKSLQNKLYQSNGSRSTEAKLWDETESRLKQEVQDLKANLDTANGALESKDLELKQAEAEIASLRAQLKGDADEPRSSPVPQAASDDDSLFGDLHDDLDLVSNTQEASVHTSPEVTVDTVDSVSNSAQLSTARASNHVLERIELEPISLLLDLNPPLQSILEQGETQVLGSQRGALTIDNDPRRLGNYLRGDNFPAAHREMMSKLDRAMRDKTNERFGLIEIADRSKEGGYRYSQRSGFLGSRRRKSIAIGETDASLLAKVGWRVPGRNHPFLPARWASNFSAQSMLVRPRMNNREFEKKMDTKDDRSVGLPSHWHKDPTNAFFKAKPASTLSSSDPSLASPASLTDILGLENLRQQQVERGYAGQFSHLSSNALLDKSRSTFSKRQAGDLTSVKEVRVELFMSLNDKHNASNRAQDNKISHPSSTSGPAIPRANAPSLSAGKPSGIPTAAAKKSNGMGASIFAPRSTPSRPSVTMRAVGLGGSMHSLPSTPSAPSAPSQGNSLASSDIAPASTPSAPSLPTNVGGDSSNIKFNPSAASFAPTVPAKKSDMSSSKSAPLSTPSVPRLPARGSDLNSSMHAPASAASDPSLSTKSNTLSSSTSAPSPAPAVPILPTKKANDSTASNSAVPPAPSVQGLVATNKGGLANSKHAVPSATSDSSVPKKKANGMGSSKYAPQSTQSASSPSTENTNNLSGGNQSAPLSDAAVPTPPTKKAGGMNESRYASPSARSHPPATGADRNPGGVQSSLMPAAAGTTPNSSAGAVATAPRAHGQSGGFDANRWGTFNLKYLNPAANAPSEPSESEDNNSRRRGRGGGGRFNGRRR